MIKNERQYKYTKRKLHEFEEDLKAVQKKYSPDKNKVALLGKGYVEHIAQLKAQIKEYMNMKKSSLPKVLRACEPAEISHQLVRLRLARGLTQAKLAALIGCKQADISRMEREDYSGYTISYLEKIVTSLNAKIEIDLIPAAI